MPLPRLWDSVGGAVKAVQTVASLLEIVHSQLGWVRSSLVTNVMQALARHMSLWLVVDLNFSISHSNNSIMDRVVGQQWNTKEVWFGATVAAWASVEVVRYSMYVTEQLGITPSILKFLRYNSFIILYPLGLIGEACGLLLALEAYKSGLCPPTFTACSNNSVGLYLAYFYLIAVVPGTPAAPRGCMSAPLLYAAGHSPLLAGFLKLYTHMFAQRRRSSRPATASPAGKADRTASLKDE